MLDPFLTDEVKTGANRNRILQMDTENNIDGECRQRRSLKENRNEKETHTQNQKDS